MHRFLILCPLLLALSCAHKQKTEEATPATPQQGPAPAVSKGPTQVPAAPTPSGEKTCGSDLDCGPKQLCIRSHCVDITPDLAECAGARVHFDFDSSEMHSDDWSVLERMARCLKADRAMHVTIEGNADERGTEDYNLALGDRRATNVEKYLETLGVSQAQLRTVSYGKEKPLCSEHNEDCWSKNRRAALKPKEEAPKKR